MDSGKFQERDLIPEFVMAVKQLLLHARRRLHCMFHVIQNVKLRLKKNVEETNVLNDINLLGKSLTSKTYMHLRNLLVNKWGEKEELNKFVEYFNNCQITAGDCWSYSTGYEYTTNNHIEGYNSALKKTTGFERKPFYNLHLFLRNEVISKSNNFEALVNNNRPKNITKCMKDNTMKAFRLKGQKIGFIQMKKDFKGFYLIAKKEGSVVDNEKMKQIVSLTFTDVATYKYLLYTFLFFEKMVIVSSATAPII
uniref:MULE domain-containing protein n=1 Tax=Rhabditophanes sp. KR3021 TaxID=114890 RepID=A0AC35TRE3_9BILA